MKPSLQRDIKINSLTSIRGLCVLLVILVHLFPYLNFTQNVNYNFGNTGVIGFFTLSSYLICKGLFDNKFSYKKFIIRRFVRIYPLFMLNIVIFIFILNYLNFINNNYTGFNYFQIWEWSLMIGNYSGAGDSNAFSHLWSIPVEMHFYLLIPLLALANKINRNRILYFLVIFSCLLNFYIVENMKNSSIWILTTSHIGSFCIGALISNNEVHLRKFAYNREVFIFLIPCLIILSSGRSFYYGRFSGMYYLLASIFFGLVILQGLNKNRTNNFLAYFGKRSYSIYLVHFTIIFIFMSYHPGGGIMKGQATLQQVVLCFIIIVAVGSLEYQILERPILKLKSKVEFIKTT